jgi:peptidoglycan/LPS O-acetylase OafA/YrhL
VLNDYRIPSDTSWGHILSVYPHQLGEVFHDDLRYPLATAVPALTIAMEAVVVAGLLFLFWPRRPLDSLTVIARGTLVGAAATILLSVNYTDFRLELVFLSAAAVGIAALAQQAADRLPGRLTVGRRSARRAI